MSAAPRARHACGFVSLVGRPNTGKSTLLNALLETKLAIVSAKPQTTRTTVQGVLTLDTPGVHEGGPLINRRMMDLVREALFDRDLLLLAVDASREPNEEDEAAFALVREAATPAILVVNKIDRVMPKERLLPVIDRYAGKHEFAACVPVSALSGDGLGRLREEIVARLPEGPALFPPDYLTDQPERFLAAEIIREQILAATRQEVPHAVAVRIEHWDETPRLTRIEATVYVERPGQKTILVGARGAGIKRLGTAAREEIEALLGRQVYLGLFVKVRPDWRESAEFLKELDWRTMAGLGGTTSAAE
jgi:GTP-binding protein Era